MNKKEQRRVEWTARVADYQASGQSMKAWSAANAVSKDQLRYWLRTLNNSPSSATGSSTTHFVPLSVRQPSPEERSSTLYVHVGPARIALQAGFDTELLREAVAALSTSC